MTNLFLNIYRRYKERREEAFCNQKVAEYYEKRNQVAGDTYFETRPQEDVRLIINNQLDNTADLVKQISSDLDVGIHAFDHGNQDLQLERLEAEYSKYLDRCGPLGGVGGDGGYVWDIVQFFNNSHFYASLMFNWLIGHVLEDIDDTIWNKVKQSFLYVYKKFKRPDETKRMNLILPNNKKRKDMIFLFDPNLDDKQLNLLFDLARNKLRDNKENSQLKKEPRPIVFEFDPQKDDWKDVTINYFA